VCGIAGILNYEHPVYDPVSQIKKMLACINYRGPDESGIFLGNNLVMGNVRLSIIDIHTGHQPMADITKTYYIVFNGEIFNYIELKKELINKGHHFQTNSDTEVLLYAYIEYGSGCLQRLNGQFAFAIWDDKNKELFLARDRVGIRPLFYLQQNSTFIFASEIKAIAEYSGINLTFNYTALAQVFTYWTVLTPGTVFQGVYELQPGHFMKITKNGIHTQQYWKLHFPEHDDEYFQGNVFDAAEELQTLLTRSVKMRLRADVPVAAYLSGGLDSSTITSFINKIMPATLQTFSIGFEENEYDETPFQTEVAEYLNTRHKYFYCTNSEIARYFPLVVWHTEIPVLRTAPVPMYCLSGKVRDNNIKVVMTGEGADEMFAGYDIFKEALIREFWARQPESKYRPLLLKKLYPYIAQFQGKNKMMFKFFYGYKLNDTSSPYYSHILRWKNTSGILNFFTDQTLQPAMDFQPDIALQNMLDKNIMHWDLLSRAQWLEIKLFMSGYLLSSQGDRVAMANSVESRYPFLDHHIIEFSVSLPADLKMHGLNEKYIIKKMMRGKLPEKIINRPKQAYRAPAGNCFFTSGEDYVSELLSKQGLNETGIFRYEMVQKLIEKITQNQQATEFENMALAGILSTQLLYHQYISPKRFRPEPSELKNCFTFIDLTQNQT
jgi:asparagine synthase (glutamine-hydrolysing)